MSIDRESLNREREQFNVLLKEQQTEIEKPFQRVIRPETNPRVPFVGLAEAQQIAEKENSQMSFHHETRGRGDTAQEAFNDWRSKLRIPHGDCLLWRAEPEIDYSVIFGAGKAVWRVYSRYAVLKPER